VTAGPREEVPRLLPWSTDDRPSYLGDSDGGSDIPVAEECG
jgi:hypothetical protein